MRHRLIAAVVLFALAIIPIRGQDGQGSKPLLYVVATSHLDSQWNWTVQDTIAKFVPATFFENFERFEKYPHYTFNYEGAIHYMWFKEYFPDAWPKVQQYVAAGRWKLSGSWIDAVDVNVPSPESLMRQALYGKRFFRQEFNRVANDVYLPDCFGFGFALPSIAMHSGLNAFSTQKLSPAWGPSILPPFPIGRWKGVDGSAVVAALKPGAYVTRVRSDISTDEKWFDDLTTAGGKRVGFRYFGVGDTGGAPDDESVGWVEKAIGNTSGRVEVRNSSADQLGRDLTPAEKAALPEYEGELLMRTHGVGCYTSQAAMKKFNRQNELLADAAERASVAASVLTGLEYPGERLRSAWTRVLWHQFHDDLTGTCIPQAYQFSWNDELASLNQFAGALTSASASVAATLDTRGPGVPLVVFNPLASARRDVVEAELELTATPASAGLRVTTGVPARVLPSQILSRTANRVRLLLLADAPPVGYAVVHVGPDSIEDRDDRERRPAAATAGPLKVSPTSLENARYRVTVDANGDIASILDKAAGRELLKSPIRLELRDDPSPDKPAWRILYDTVASPVREYPGPPQVRVVEKGPVRVAIEVTRKAAGSTFVQKIALTDGGDRIDVENTIDWRSPNTLLKAAFPLAASNAKATYDLGLGTIDRGNNTPDHYEVPAQQWADVTDASGAFGVAILNDGKYGWDKPADDVLRLTLLHTAKPKATPYQGSNDLGRHQFTYAIAGHTGDWRTGAIPLRASALNQRLVAFQTAPHAGGSDGAKTASLVTVDTAAGQVAVRALKKAEDSDEIVLRLQELYGRPGEARVTFVRPVESVREINAAEEPVGAFEASGAGALTVTLGPYQPRTFAVRLHSAPRGPAAAARSTLLALPFNLDGMSSDRNRADGDFDGKGRTLAAELLPGELTLGRARFTFGSATPGALNVVVANGQRIGLPPSGGNRLYLLASAIGGDVTAPFTIERHAGPKRVETLTIREWQGPVGQWDSRLKSPRQLREVSVAPLTSRNQTWTAEAIQDDMVVEWDPATGEVRGMEQIRPGFVKRDEIAWIGTHRHGRDGDQIYIPSYVFAYSIALPADAAILRLPMDGRIRILAATVVSEPSGVRPARPLYAADLPEPAVSVAAGSSLVKR